MATVGNKQLISEVVNARRVKFKLTEEQYAFIMERYFHYAIPAFANGYTFNGCKTIILKLAFIVYTDIPRRLRSMFSYSSKMFGYTFLPICTDRFFKKYRYNFKPSKSILDKINEVTETDHIYTLMEK